MKTLFGLCFTSRSSFQLTLSRVNDYGRRGNRLSLSRKTWHTICSHVQAVDCQSVWTLITDMRGASSMLEPATWWFPGRRYNYYTSSRGLNSVGDRFSLNRLCLGFEMFIWLSNNPVILFKDLHEIRTADKLFILDHYWLTCMLIEVRIIKVTERLFFQRAHLIQVAIGQKTSKKILP